MSKILKSFGMAALLVALLAGTGMAADDTVVTGEVQSSVSIIAPAATDFDTFTTPTERIDAAIESGSTKAVETTTNSGYGLTVSVSEADGKMAHTVTSDALTNALVVDGTNNGANADVTEANPPAVGLDYSSVSPDADGEIIFDAHDTEGLDGNGAYDFDIDFVQTIDGTDLAGEYSITVTFTATARTT